MSFTLPLHSYSVELNSETTRAGELASADPTGDAAEFTPGRVAPFLLSPAFAHPASRPTAHEWLQVKRIERGVVCPFIHSGEVRDA